MKTTRTILGALALGAGMLLFVGTPMAQASTVHTSTHATMNHAAIHSGQTAIVSVSVAPKLPGQAVYLQRYYGGAWHSVSSARLNRASHAAFTVRPTARGVYTYRASHRATRTVRASVSTTVHVTVQTAYTGLASYTNTGSQQEPTIRIPVADYTLRYNYSCFEPYSNFLSIVWSNANFDMYEYVMNEPADGVTSGSGTWYGHQGAHTGYFDIETQDSCTWAFNVSYTAWH